MTTLAIFGLGVPELLIILAVVLLLFGGSRLAGLGKSTGRALKEFKQETKGLKADEDEERPIEPPQQSAPQRPAAADYQQPPATNISDRPAGEVRRDV
jgi:sec-independent protein translocase protein TatA